MFSTSYLHGLLPAENAASAAIEAAEETTTSGAAALSTIIAPTGPAAAAVTGASNTTSNHTASAASAASAAAASETQLSSPLNATNDPNRCHVNNTVTGGEPGINPFCKPTAGQIILAGTEFEGEIPRAYAPMKED